MGTEASAMGALQAFIDEQETFDAVEYGIRSIELSRGPYGASGIHAAQIVRGCQAATRILGRFVAQDAGTLRELKAARKEQRETLKALRSEMGSARQLRIALAA